MAFVNRDDGGLWLETDDDTVCLTRWEAVKLALALIWSACLPFKPRAVYKPAPIDPRAAEIVNRALALLHEKTIFLDKIDKEVEISGPATIKIRTPERYSPINLEKF